MEEGAGVQKTKTPDFLKQIYRQRLGVEVETEYKFHPTRRWRFDVAIPEYKIALEIEGGVWCGGRHTSSAGFMRDMEKYNTATLMGWRLFRCTPETKFALSTINMLKEAMITPPP